MIPPIPEEILGVRNEGVVPLRYEDLTQDGRLRPIAVPPALGVLVWPKVMTQEHAGVAREQGIVPILSRMVIQVGEGPIPAVYPLYGRGVSHAAAVRNASGEIERLMLMMWVDLEGQEGWTHTGGPPGKTLTVGRVYAEHVFTRLFGAPSERRLRTLPWGTPPGDWPWTPFESVGPTEGESLHQRLSRLRFGMSHTDANFHVNSMVYPRLFEERAIDAMAEAGLPWGELAAREVEVMWRKPFFAGEEAEVRVQIARDAGGLRASGSFGEVGGGERCRITMRIA